MRRSRGGTEWDRRWSDETQASNSSRRAAWRARPVCRHGNGGRAEISIGPEISRSPVSTKRKQHGWLASPTSLLFGLRIRLSLFHRLTELFVRGQPLNFRADALPARPESLHSRRSTRPTPLGA